MTPPTSDRAYEVSSPVSRGSDHPTAFARRSIQHAGGLGPRVMRNTPCCILFMSYPPEKTHFFMRNAPEIEQIWCPRTKKCCNSNVPTSKSGIRIANQPARNSSIYLNGARYRCVIRLSNLCDTEAYGPVRNTRIERFRVTDMT